MGFRENLRQKIQVNRLADQIRRSMKPADPPPRIDREALRTLFQMSRYTARKERDLELYCQEMTQGGTFIIVLDNELKRYHTSIDDVVLRKSPTLKEMISIRNAIKILNDKDVVVSAKADTLQHLQDEIIASLDLSYSADDIEALAKDGGEALKNNYTDGIIEVLTLMAELLGWPPVPKALETAHCHAWGGQRTATAGATEVEPVIVFNLMHNRLKMIRNSVNTLDAAALRRFHQIAKGEEAAELEGDAVIAELKRLILSRR
ncbi:MAG: hypothetical protein HZB87_10580 [Desulfatitalea sp.]|nr:hypothetical protein [Desulfatitalea sp.]MBI5895059.1 hypothetical protein [Desulfobacterales bacterium]